MHQLYHKVLCFTIKTTWRRLGNSKTRKNIDRTCIIWYNFITIMTMWKTLKQVEQSKEEV